MKKAFLFLLLNILFLVGCSNEYVVFSGESNHWDGKYSVNIDGNEEYGIYTFRYKNSDGNTEFKSLEIVINQSNGRTSRKEEIRKGGRIEITSSCMGCAVINKDEAITVTIKWDNKYEETFTLKSKK
ncbi:hypothetical protein [Bacillus cereus]|uniref:hypothetical protein n=1 Tax=Bacillus cereus TaxID=1396 RepID=UPI00397F0AA2